MRIRLVTTSAFVGVTLNRSEGGNTPSQVGNSLEADTACGNTCVDVGPRVSRNCLEAVRSPENDG